MASKRVAAVNSKTDKSKMSRRGSPDSKDKQFEDYENFQPCPKHKLESRLYCETHKAQFCSMCVKKDHGECSVKSLSTIYHTFNQYLEQLKHTKFAVNIIEGNLQSYRHKLEVDLKMCERQIKDIYREIHENISELEKKSLEELEDVIGKEKAKISDNFFKAEEVSKQAGNAIEVCKSAKQPNELSECTLTLQGSIRSTARQLKKLQESCREVSIDVKKNCKFTDKLSIDTNAILRITPSCQASLYKTDTLITHCSPFDFITKYNCKGYHSNAICMVPDTDSEMVLATHTFSNPHILQHISVKGDLIKSVDVPDEPTDVFIYDHYVAVPFKKMKQINIYNISNFSEHTQLEVPGRCCSVCRHKDTFYVAFTIKRVIKRLNGKGEVISSSEKILRGSTVVRGLPSGEGVLVSDTLNYRLIAFSNDLSTQQFVISNGINIPRGFCYNSQGGVYVCSISNSCIKEFNKEGKHVATILDDRHGIKRPISICYDIKNEILAIANIDYNEVRIYKGS